MIYEVHGTKIDTNFIKNMYLNENSITIEYGVKKTTIDVDFCDVCEIFDMDLGSILYKVLVMKLMKRKA